MLATDNDAPLAGRDTTSPYYYGDVEVRSAEEVSLRTKSLSSHQFPTYVGAILSADRSVVYWVNETRPLP